LLQAAESARTEVLRLEQISLTAARSIVARVESASRCSALKEQQC
jgi:hypothetical protein